MQPIVMRAPSPACHGSRPSVLHKGSQVERRRKPGSKHQCTHRCLMLTTHLLTTHTCITHRPGCYGQGPQRTVPAGAAALKPGGPVCKHLSAAAAHRQQPGRWANECAARVPLFTGGQHQPESGGAGVPVACIGYSCTLAAQLRNGSCVRVCVCVLHAGALGLPAQGPNGPVPILAEEVVRGSAAAALSLLLTAVEPRWD